MAEKKASLTVLGGPLAGTRFVLEGVGSEVTLGSDASCPFQLALAGVSPQHARIRTEASAFTIEDAGSQHGLHVNDSRVTDAVPLRNGDIVWLGTPGEADVVMLQCILPSRPAAAPAPPPPEPEPSLSEDETLALALAAETAAAPQTDLMEQAATGFYTADEAAAASGAPFAADSDGAAAVPFATAGDNDLVVADDETMAQAAADETVAQAVPFAVDAVPPPPPPTHFEDDTREQTYEFEESDQATVVMGAPEEAAPVAVYSSESGFMEEDPSTVVMASEPEPTMAIEAPPAPVAPPPRTEHIPKPPAAAPPAPPARPATPPATASTPAAPRPARAAAAPPAAPRKPAPRPQPSPRVADAADEAGASERAPRSAPPVALYAGLGAAALVVLGGGYWAFTKFRGAAPSSTVAEAPPPTQPAAPPTPRPQAPPSEPPIEVPVEVQPEAADTPPAPLPTPAAVPTPTAGPTTTLKAPPSPLPSPSPAAKKGAPTPPPVTTPAGPSPEQLRAQQVASLLGQGDAALASGQFDQAIGHFDEVLRLDPGNGKATADRASAVAQRDQSRKKFVAGRTVVKTEKASGGLAGFEGAEVQRTPDFSGRIEFEMSPASGLKPGDAWTLKFYLVNDGKKGIKIGGVTATTNVNGTGAGGPVASSAREVAPQQRAQLGQITGSWREGTASWVADVLVTANKGDSLKNTLTWR